MTEFLIKTGQFLQIKREKLKWNKSEAARRLGLSMITLASYENGSMPSPKACEKLIKTYSITEEEAFMYGLNRKTKRESPKSNVSGLMKETEKLIKEIGLTLDSIDGFEKAIKQKAIAKLLQVKELLSEITIIDEGL